MVPYLPDSVAFPFVSRRAAAVVVVAIVFTERVDVREVFDR